MILFLILAAAATTDQRYGKICHWQILSGILVGFLMEGPVFFGRMLLICTGFYVFFVLHMMGAGDVKLIGMIAGFLGIWEGLTVIFFGFLLAAVYVVGKRILAACRQARPLICNIKYNEICNDRIHLGPWLLFGYALFLML